MEKWDPDHVEKRLALLNFPSVGDDIGFSWRPCWTCQRPLGGERVELVYVEEEEIFKEEICYDCAMYIANGELPIDYEEVIKKC